MLTEIDTMCKVYHFFELGRPQPHSARAGAGVIRKKQTHIQVDYNVCIALTTDITIRPILPQPLHQEDINTPTKVPSNK
jgi:hypothetical protein